MTHLTQEELRHRVVLLHRDRMSRRAIARALRISRNTVSRILRAHRRERAEHHAALPSPGPRAARVTLLDDYREQVNKLLETYKTPPITAQRVYEELQASGFRGSYSVVKRHVRKVRPPAKPEPSLPVAPVGPAEMAECDWSPYTIRFTHGPPRLLQCFGYLLSYSRRKVFRFYPRSDFHSLMDGHVETFQQLGGVPRACKYDNQKAVVLRWEGQQPIYNPRFILFATYYDFRVVACRPYHPNDKPGVERSFYELERSFFNGRSFRDEDDLRAQLAHWQEHVCDVRVLRKYKQSSLQRFAEEREHLLPLPVHPYDTARVVYRVCDIEGFISWNGSRYSVPYEHVTDLLPVRVTQSEIFAYGRDLSCIARHSLLPPGAGQDTIADSHRRAPSRRGADVDQLRKAFDDLGEDALLFFEGTLLAQPRSAAYHGRRVLLLRERFGSDDLVKALAHAKSFGAFDYRSVERILVARAKPRRLDEYVAEDTVERLKKVLGENTTAPRDLSEYDELPTWTTPSTEERRAPCLERPAQPAQTQTSSPCDNSSEPTSNDSE